MKDSKEKILGEHLPQDMQGSLKKPFKIFSSRLTRCCPEVRSRFLTLGGIVKGLRWLKHA